MCEFLSFFLIFALLLLQNFYFCWLSDISDILTLDGVIDFSKTGRWIIFKSNSPLCISKFYTLQIAVYYTMYHCIVDLCFPAPAAIALKIKIETPNTEVKPLCSIWTVPSRLDNFLRKKLVTSSTMDFDKFWRNIFMSWLR